MNTLPNCPKCNSEYTYQDQDNYICPECAHEWVQGGSSSAPEQELAETTTTSGEIKDANGTLLQNGDSVTVIKFLKVKGSSETLKAGTKVKNIRLVEDASDGHNIDCKVDGIGSMKLKSEFVRKV